MGRGRLVLVKYSNMLVKSVMGRGPMLVNARLRPCQPLGAGRVFPGRDARPRGHPGASMPYWGPYSYEEESMTMIEQGNRAPDFAIPAHTGETVRLGDHAGKYVLLWFYPKADTPG